jgi:small subunit ribosomal protein S20
LPHQSSSAKRHRQSEKHRMRNKMFRSRVRTAIRKFVDTTQGGAQAEAEKELLVCQSLLDRAVTKGIVHRNLAGRKKHRLQKMLQKMS